MCLSATCFVYSVVSMCVCMCEPTNINLCFIFSDTVGCSGVRGGREEIKKSIRKKKKPEVLFKVCEKYSFIEVLL